MTRQQQKFLRNTAVALMVVTAILGALLVPIWSSERPMSRSEGETVTPESALASAMRRASGGERPMVTEIRPFFDATSRPYVLAAMVASLAGAGLCKYRALGQAAP